MTQVEMSTEEHVEVAAAIEPEAKKRVFKAAIESFSQQGRAGSRIDEIVKESRVNVRMIYHYFGSKDGLYDEVLKAVCLNRSAFLRKAKASSSSWGPEELAKSLLDWSMQESAYRRILDWESCSDWKWCSMAVDSQIEAPADLAPEGLPEHWIARIRFYQQIVSPLSRDPFAELSSEANWSMQEELNKILTAASYRNDTV